MSEQHATKGTTGRRQGESCRLNIQAVNVSSQNAVKSLFERNSPFKVKCNDVVPIQ